MEWLLKVEMGILYLLVLAVWVVAIVDAATKS